MHKEVLNVVLRKTYFSFLIGFILVFNSSPQEEVIPLALKLGAITLIGISVFILADRSKFIQAIIYGGVLGTISALTGYIIGAAFYDYFL